MRLRELDSNRLISAFRRAAFNAPRALDRCPMLVPKIAAPRPISHQLQMRTILIFRPRKTPLATHCEALLSIVRALRRSHMHSSIPNSSLKRSIGVRFLELQIADADTSPHWALDSSYRCLQFARQMIDPTDTAASLYPFSKTPCIA